MPEYSLSKFKFYSDGLTRTIVTVCICLHDSGRLTREGYFIVDISECLFRSFYFTVEKKNYIPFSFIFHRSYTDKSFIDENTIMTFSFLFSTVCHTPINGRGGGSSWFLFFKSYE
jgi:hypothetical protein